MTWGSRRSPRASPQTARWAWRTYLHIYISTIYISIYLLYTVYISTYMISTYLLSRWSWWAPWPASGWSSAAAPGRCSVSTRSQGAVNRYISIYLHLHYLHIYVSTYLLYIICLGPLLQVQSGWQPPGAWQQGQRHLHLPGTTVCSSLIFSNSENFVVLHESLLWHMFHVVQSHTQHYSRQSVIKQSASARIDIFNFHFFIPLFLPTAVQAAFLF